MTSLFDSIVDVIPRSTWTPEVPPSLDGIPEVFLNFESTGLRWFEKDLPIAVSLAVPDGRTWYLPWGHRPGGNLDEATVYRWAQTELRGKRITNLSTRIDIHFARVWGDKLGNGGLDFESMGCEVSDVGHYAALLDDHRQHLSLDSIIPDYLAEIPIPRLDESRMKEYHAGEVAARSMYNVDAVRRLKAIMWPLLDEQDLQRVRALEDRVIYPTCEMEKNGSLIDTERLDRWIKESQKRLEGYLWQLAKELGWQCNPDSPKDMERAFRQLKLPVEWTAATSSRPYGSPSFTDAVLKTHEHPTVMSMRKATKLASLRSKFLVNTRDVLCSDGILRYALHQLRAAKDDFADAGEAGTVTGRYSSTKIAKNPDVGVNIQQRMKAARQRLSFGYNEDDASHDDEIFLVRRLHIARSGYQLLASDMDQAQYRIFASYANNPKIIQAYRDDPTTSFHKFMWGLIKPYAALEYKAQKDLNFAYLFGAGLVKMALMIRHISASEFAEIRRTRNYNHPKLALTKEIKRIYKREVPEIDALLEEASFLAKSECDDRCRDRSGRLTPIHFRGLRHRGYVKDLLGRRMRFPDNQRLHKAFNGVDQMCEATYMKTKLVELHEARRDTGLILEITNHDEIVGSIVDAEGAQKVDAILNRQSYPQLRVPLTWSTGIGPNWAETK